MIETVRCFLTGGLLVCFMAACQAVDAVGQMESSIDLETYRWEKRVLLVFAPTPDHAAYGDLKRQIQSQQQAFEERDMVLIEVVAGGPSRVGAKPLNPAGAAQLRVRFDVADEQFGLFLIGKDGGVKLRAEQPDLNDVFALIDTMPMRQREMRQRQ